MPTPLPPRQTASTSRTGATKTNSTSDWRCTHCAKLLGVRRDVRMHLRFARGHEYLVGFPVVATCRSCGTLNQASATER